MATERLTANRFSNELRQMLPAECASLDQLEEQLEAWETLFRRARGMAQHEERRLRESRQRTARRQIGNVAASTAIRTVDLASGLIELINTAHIHPSYVVARATVETASVPSYMLKNMVPLLTRRRAERTDEVLRRLTVGVDPGLEFVRDDGTTTRPFPVSSLMKALYSQMDGAMQRVDYDAAGLTMRRLYSVLSDHSHPNFSAMHLSSSIDDEGMTWNRSRGWTDSALHQVVGPTYLAMWFGGQALDEVLVAANQHHLVLEVKSR